MTTENENVANITKITRTMISDIENGDYWSTPIRNKSTLNRIFHKTSEGDYVFMNNGILFAKIGDLVYLSNESQRRNLPVNQVDVINTLPNELGNELVDILMYKFPELKLAHGYRRLTQIECVACDRSLTEQKFRPNPKTFVGKLYQKPTTSGTRNLNKYHTQDLCNCIRRNWDETYKITLYNGPLHYKRYRVNAWCRECFWHKDRDEKLANRRTASKNTKTQTEIQKKLFMRLLE